MSIRRRAFAALALALLALPARADVTLPGSQHIGDGENTAFDPRDPVTRAQMRANPTRFHLSQTTTITAIRLESPIDLDNRLQVFVNDMTTPRAGTTSGSCDAGGACTYTLATPLTLTAGVHTIWPDGGCSNGTFVTTCPTGENDFGFSTITLVSTAISASRSFHRRSHLGDSSDSNNNYGGRYYPDAPDGTTLNFTFTLDVARLLSEVRFYRLRDVGNAAPGWATVSINGTSIGRLNSDGNPEVLTSGLLLDAGVTHTLTVTAGNDDVSWDDIVLILVNNPATTPGAFNAIDTTVAASAVATGPITTKIAGAAFDLDVVALASGALFTTYSGTVTVELLNAATSNGVLDAGTNCDTGWVSLGTLASVTFGAADGGRKTASLTYAEALRHARLRIHDAALNVTGCSVDNFAIRPSTFAAIQATHDSPIAPGTTEALASGPTFTGTTTPVHRAGRPFTIQATAVNAGGMATQNYAGSPLLTAGSSLLGSSKGEAEATDWTTSAGRLRTDRATYDEAGAVRLHLLDTDFASVDSDDTPDPQRHVGPVAFDVGRFTPDHFTLTPEDVVVEPVLTPTTTCGTFSYLGEPLTLSPVVFSITAVDATGTKVVTNYTDAALYKLPATNLPETTFVAETGMVVRVNAPTAPAPPDNALSNPSNGVTRFTLLFDQVQFVRTAPVTPFTAEIAMQLGALGEGDGIDFSPSPGRYGQPLAGEGIPFSPAAAKATRFGRLVLDNAHGSENLPLDVPLRTEYWEAVGGDEGFARNLADNCTAVAAGNVILARDPAGLPTAATMEPFVNGAGAIRLSAPGTPGLVDVSVDLSNAVPVLPWLRGDWDGDTDWNEDADDPSARATFGLASGEERRIYQREVIGN